MPLALHLSIHFTVAVLTGYFCGRYFKQMLLGLIAGVMGGCLIDLDHVLEYFLTFGLRFSFTEFFNGYQFLASERTYLFFHAWELVPILLIIAYLVRQKKKVAIFLISLAAAGFVHLISDCFINNYSPRNYSIIYRASQGFKTEQLLSPGQYQNYLIYRERAGF
jgi:hypothetical protein